MVLFMGQVEVPASLRAAAGMQPVEVLSPISPDITSPPVVASTTGALQGRQLEGEGVAPPTVPRRLTGNRRASMAANEPAVEGDLGDEDIPSKRSRTTLLPLDPLDHAVPPTLVSRVMGYCLHCTCTNGMCCT
jgi:hypothetical protein